MKVKILDAHDRLLQFKKNDFDIGECCQNLIDKRPFGDTPFYIFAHTRTDDDGVTKRLIWQPRLTKPKAQTNSMLFKGYPGKDKVLVIWMIPDRTLWSQYKKGLLTESNIVCDSIEKFQTNRELIEKSEDDDLDDEKIRQIYRDLSISAKQQKAMIKAEENKSLIKQDSLEEFSSALE